MSAKKLPVGKTTNRMMVHDWNRKHPVGTRVKVTRDDDSVIETETLCEAWLVGEHTAVVLLEGISGAYALARVEAIDVQSPKPKVQSQKRAIPPFPV